MVQMILFKELRTAIHARHDRSSDQIAPSLTHLAGAVVNNLFATVPMDRAVVEFAAANRGLVEDELRQLADSCPGLLPILTDALRMKTLCDNQEGIHSIPSLLMAKALGILQEERVLPLPTTFMLQVRQLAAVQGLITPAPAAQPVAD